MRRHCSLPSHLALPPQLGADVSSKHNKGLKFSMLAKLKPPRLIARLFQTSKKSALQYHPGEPVPVVGLLCSGDTASLTYLLKPYVAKLGRESVCIDTGDKAFADGRTVACESVVIVRYLPSEWIQPLREYRASGGHVIYFMDDDLMDPQAQRNLPASYGKKIREFATRHRSSLESLCDEFWVSTPYLAAKYSCWNPALLTPGICMADIEPEIEACSVCYHGTASHQAELEWLVPVMSAIQNGNDTTRFEVFGDHRVNKMYRMLPRVAVLHPMSWPSYLAYTSSTRHDIGMAPLLPDPFNAARGPTKFFDFVRMGAVGVYSDVAPYRDFIRDGIDGILLANEPALWVQSVLELSKDAPRRKKMAKAARERALSMAWT